MLLPATTSPLPGLQKPWRWCPTVSGSSIEFLLCLNSRGKSGYDKTIFFDFFVPEKERWSLFFF
jgi:hypothetical protein